MSFSFNGSPNNPYKYNQGQSPAKDEVFIKPKIEFEFQIKKTENDISLFDITSIDELNDTGRELKINDVWQDIDPQFDGPKWLGLTGKGVFGDEPKLMETTFLKAPPRQKDRDGNPIKMPENPGNDWNWNTFA